MSVYRRSTSVNSQRSGSSIYRRQMNRDMSGSMRLGSIRRQTSRGNLNHDSFFKQIYPKKFHKLSFKKMASIIINMIMSQID